jgi:hypothetical protein
LQLGGVLVLSLARVQVEVDAAAQLTVGDYVVGRDAVGPDRRVGDLAVLDPEQPARDIEQAGPHPGEVEVAAHLLGVDIEVLPTDQLAVVRRGRGVEVEGVGLVATAAFEQGGVVATPGVLGCDRETFDEIGDRFGRADHLDLGVVRRPAVVAEQPGPFVAQVQHLVQDGVVRGPAAVEELDRQRPPGGGVAREGAERNEIGVVGGDLDQAVGARRVGLDEIGRQAVQHLGGDPDGPDVVAQHPGEILVENGQPVGDLAQSCALVLGAIDAATPEVAQDLIAHAGRGGVETAAVGGGENLVQLPVEVALGEDARYLLGPLLPQRADVLVRVHLVEQLGRRVGAAQRDVGVVPPAQHLGRGPGGAVLELIERGLGLGQQGVDAGGEPLAPGGGIGGQDEWGQRSHLAEPIR